MKNYFIISLLLLMLASCKTNKSVKEPETLPKDIALKPENNYSQQLEGEKMSQLIKEIDSIIAAEQCTDVREWRSTPVGSKACGGPASYLAYPIKLEDKILPKIALFTSLQSDFNRKYGMMSDCAIVPPPAGIKCENGNAILVRGSEEIDVPQ